MNRDLWHLQRSLELFHGLIEDRIVSLQRGEEISLTRVHFTFLRHLVWNPGRTTRQLADHFEISPPAVSQNIQRLVDKGLVKGEPSPRDRRNVLLYATESGNEIVRKWYSEIEAHLDGTLARMDDSDREALRQGVDAFIIASTDSAEAAKRMCLHCGEDDPACPINEAHRRITGVTLGTVYKDET